MFCFQCEQTAKNEGCTKQGVCGKTDDVAELQDLLIYAVKGLSLIAHEGRKAGIQEEAVNRFTSEAHFSTLTNVNFDRERFFRFINECVQLRDALKEKVKAKVKAKGGKVDFDHDAANFTPAETVEGMIEQGRKVGVLIPKDLNEDIRSLRELLTYGLKGIAAYADHARILGKSNPEVDTFMHKALAATLDDNLGADEYVGLVMECGQVNYKTMELLDAANTGAYGDPVPTKVPLGVKKGKAIIISGHDLLDLEQLLQQTEGKGIDIYTHGEMLPTHGYPKLKEKYSHFYGHFGTAWQNQKKEFDNIPAAILMTTNCIQRPAKTYQDRIFTTGLVGFPDMPHIPGTGKGKDFTPVIEKALELPGFPADEEKGHVMVGFGHKTVLSLADKVVGAVKNKDIRHFFLVGGCDGAKPGRNYYTEFVSKLPKDCVILTLACGKFRFFDMDLGDIGGIPRLLDVGQCNDAYSAIRIATALADAFNCGVNDLPLSMILSWYEQKACAILLTLLSLGIRDIRLGPSLPAFITPNILNVLVEKFNIMPISTPDEDLKAILG